MKKHDNEEDLSPSEVASVPASNRRHLQLLRLQLTRPRRHTFRRRMLINAKSEIPNLHSPSCQSCRQHSVDCRSLAAAAFPVRSPKFKPIAIRHPHLPFYTFIAPISTAVLILTHPSTRHRTTLLIVDIEIQPSQQVLLPLFVHCVAQPEPFCLDPDHIGNSIKQRLSERPPSKLNLCARGM